MVILLLSQYFQWEWLWLLYLIAALNRPTCLCPTVLWHGWNMRQSLICYFRIALIGIALTEFGDLPKSRIAQVCFFSWFVCEPNVNRFVDVQMLCFLPFVIVLDVGEYDWFDARCAKTGGAL